MGQVGYKTLFGSTQVDSGQLRSTQVYSGQLGETWGRVSPPPTYMEWLSKARTYRAYARTKGAGGFSRLPREAPKHPKTPPPRPPNYHIGSEKGVRSNEFNVCCMQIKINRIKLNKIILISKSKQSKV